MAEAALKSAGWAAEKREGAKLSAWRRENRVGKFVISEKLIQGQPEVARLALASVFPVRAECLYNVHGIEYFAYGPSFDPCQEGCVTPLYELEIEQVGRMTAKFRFVRACGE